MDRTAPYLVSCDGDCVLPPDHIAIHCRHRRQNTVSAGDCYRLSRARTAQLNTDTRPSGGYAKLVSRSERQRLRRKHRKAVLYNPRRHPTKPQLIGNNFAVWRSDYVRSNGFDERFVGWGGEDDDFRIRLRRAGVQVRSILKWTQGYHLWHPAVPSCPGRWRDGRDVNDFEHRATALRDVRGGLRYPHSQPGVDRAPNRLQFAEVLFALGQGSFSGRADLNGLVTDSCASPTNHNGARADIVVTREDARHVVHKFATADARRPQPLAG